ncbi:inactive protein RESTRICTED TEV MOVEMENT 2-like [Cornus florida]|uniref:inactive protein RESTRICTED TEV MOVEMENT 2-like n=1 Tax=Cornus florida TaxID=4283 RepID=UPI0028A05E8F|nr:inactive protein RESTRICTED TEV MOVEMENT 2-like [Cornus florida]
MSQTYEDFEPASEWVREEDCDTLVVYLGGFKKEQLRAQLTTPRNLVVSGERPLGKNKWRRFQKVVTISENCDTDKITAKFEDSVLTIKQPKLITPKQKQDQEKPITTTTALAPKPPQNLQPPQPQPPQNNVQQPQPQPPPPPPPPQKSVQQQPQARNIDDQEAAFKKADMANQENEKTDDGLAKPKTVNVPDQKLQQAQEKDNNIGDGKIRSEREKSSSSLLSSDDKNVDKEKEKISPEKTSSTEKREVLSTTTRKQVDGGLENPLKIPKQLMNLVLVLLCVIVLGLYFSNSIWSYKKPEN